MQEVIASVNMPIYMLGFPFILGWFGLVISAAIIPESKIGWLKTSILIGRICFVVGVLFLIAINLPAISRESLILKLTRLYGPNHNSCDDRERFA